MTKTLERRRDGEPAEVVLEVRNLRAAFSAGGRLTKAVDGISYSMRAGETVAIVGESGSGKSAHARAIMGLLPGSGRVTGGEVLFQGRDIVGLPASQMRHVRGGGIGMVFQEPMNSLNPVISVGPQIAETIRAHAKVSKGEAKERALGLMRKVRLRDPERHYDEYPHQLSGGMCQRVMLAIAIAAEPALLIADEPTTALDVTVQAQILDLIAELSRDLNMATVLITHDLGVVARYADRVLVMYAGKLVEEAEAHALFKQPAHPYTADLLRSLPRMQSAQKLRLEPIRGNPPNVQDLPPGCSYAPRCSQAQDVCRSEEPPLMEIAPARRSACWFAEEQVLESASSALLGGTR
jgi:oligopeptide transport system ATP-binding protein